MARANWLCSSAFGQNYVRGFRTRQVILVTTLLNRDAYPSF